MLATHQIHNHIIPYLSGGHCGNCASRNLPKYIDQAKCIVRIHAAMADKSADRLWNEIKKYSMMIKLAK